MRQSPDAPSGDRRWRGYIFRAITWLVAIACFYYVYTRIAAAAARDGLTAFGIPGGLLRRR